MREVRVPAPGESVAEATLAAWFRRSGEGVAAQGILCELKTDEIMVGDAAPVAGIPAELKAAAGETLAPAPCWRGSKTAKRGPTPARPIKENSR